MGNKITRISEVERAYVMQVLDTQFRTSTSGEMTKRLEKKFAELFGVKYAISLTNGTATLHSALVAAGIGPGDEVIVPPLTMASTSFAVLHAGGIPVYADVDPNTFNIDPFDIKKKVTSRTRAIITVALYGLSPDMDPIMQIARQHNVIVIEDDAQCFLGYYKGRIVGSLGHMASFSFQSSKHMTSGEGGMVITDDLTLANKIRCFSNLGYGAVSGEPGKGKITKDVIQDPAYERHVMVGYNYRMSELCAAVALGQTERLSQLVSRRMDVAKMYSEVISGCKWLVPQAIPKDYIHSYWTFVARLNNNDAFSWYDFRKKYVEFGGDGIYAAWQLTYLEPPFLGKYSSGLCPVAESLQPHLLQFKTNYTDLDVARYKTKALAQTIRYFGK